MAELMPVQTNDWWSSVAAFGESAWEGLSEKIGTTTNAFLDSELQNLAAKAASPEVAKESEPVKGSDISGQPIVVMPASNAGAMLTTNQMLIGGGALGVLLLAFLVIKK